MTAREEHEEIARLRREFARMAAANEELHAAAAEEVRKNTALREQLWRLEGELVSSKAECSRLAGELRTLGECAARLRGRLDGLA